MKVFLINDGRSTSNWGLQASTQALLDLFIEKSFDLVTLTHSELHRKYIFDLKISEKKVFNDNSRILSKLSPFNLRIPETADQYSLFTDLWTQGHGGALASRIIKNIQEADIIIFNAEGSTYRKNFGALAGLFILYYASNVYNKKTLFANGSFTISKVDNVLTGIARKLYMSGVQFFVREPISARCLGSVGLTSRVVPDSVFYYAEEETTHLKKNNTFAVSKSMLPMCNFSDINNDPFFQLVSRISQETSLSPVFYARDPEDQMIKQYISCIPNSSLGVLKSQEFKDVQHSIGRSQFLLSGRYHHLIFAINSRTNICPLSSSSHKNEGLMELLNSPLTSSCFDPTDLTSQVDQIVNYCTNIISNQQAGRNPINLRDNMIKEYCEFFNS